MVDRGIGRGLAAFLIGSVAAGVLLVSGLTSAGAQAQPDGSVDRVEILGYGIYRLGDRRKVDAAETPAGKFTITSSSTLETATDVICARLGVSFGLEFRVIGAPEGRMVELEWVTHFPEPGLVNPSGKHSRLSRFRRTTGIGRTQRRFYTFDDGWEIVPGQWVLEFRHNGRTLGSKRFLIKAMCEIS